MKRKTGYLLLIALLLLALVYGYARYTAYLRTNGAQQSLETTLENN